MQLLKSVVIGLGILILLSMALLTYGLYQKASDPGWRLFSRPAPAEFPAPATATPAAPDAKAFESEYIREKVETKAGWQFTNPDEAWMNGFPDEIQDFCEAAATGREPVSGSLLGRDVVAVCYSAYLSAATGKRVDVPTG